MQALVGRQAAPRVWRPRGSSSGGGAAGALAARRGSGVLAAAGRPTGAAAAAAAAGGGSEQQTAPSSGGGGSDAPVLDKPAAAAAAKEEAIEALLRRKKGGGRGARGGGGGGAGGVEPKVKVESAVVDLATGKAPATAGGAAETRVVQVLGAFFAVLMAEGLVLAGSGFLPTEVDAWVRDALYPSFSPQMLLFLGMSSAYGLYKTGKLPGQKQL